MSNESCHRPVETALQRGQDIVWASKLTSALVTSSCVAVVSLNVIKNPHRPTWGLSCRASSRSSLWCTAGILLAVEEKEWGLELFRAWTRFPRSLRAGEGEHVGVGGGPKSELIHSRWRATCDQEKQLHFNSKLDICEVLYLICCCSEDVFAL